MRSLSGRWLLSGVVSAVNLDSKDLVVSASEELRRVYVSRPNLCTICAYIRILIDCACLPARLLSWRVDKLTVLGSILLSS